MDRFDLIVIGSGAGTHIASMAVKNDLGVALIDHGPIGGTCLNNGCVPSKMLIYPADVIRTLHDAKSVGVDGRIANVDFQKIMGRMRSVVQRSRINLEAAIESKKGLALYRDTAEFVGDYTLKSGDRTLTAPRIVIASGARPLIPPIPGLKEAGYLDNISLLGLLEPPKSLIVIGAGYIGCEYSHFFSAIGTEVTLLGRSRRVLDNEDPEICRIVKSVLSNYVKLYTDHEAVNVEVEGKKKVVSARNRLDGKIYNFEAEEILVATGRRSNSDILKPEKTGVETDDHGWIKVNDYLETTKSGIWAIGDAIGKHMFRHTANYEAGIVSHNIFAAKNKDERELADFHAVPHAVFTHPLVAGVGMKEAEATSAGYKILIGRARYTDVSKGIAMAEENGFVKVVIEEETGRILGCSIVGSNADTLIQQIVYLMNTEYQGLMPLIRSQVIHPTINEVIVTAFSELEHPYDFIESEDKEQIDANKKKTVSG
ncbi:MAG: dihydrolipoyl dehydrogenase [Methanotrichaceae archaeon]